MTGSDWIGQVRKAREGSESLVERQARFCTLDGDASPLEVLPFWVDPDAGLARKAADRLVREWRCVEIFQSLEGRPEVNIEAWQIAWEALGQAWNEVVSGETFELRRVIIGALVRGVASGSWDERALRGLWEQFTREPAYLRSIDLGSFYQALVETRFRGISDALANFWQQQMPDELKQKLGRTEAMRRLGR